MDVLFMFANTPTVSLLMMPSALEVRNTVTFFAEIQLVVYSVCSFMFSQTIAAIKLCHNREINYYVYYDLIVMATKE